MVEGVVEKFLTEQSKISYFVNGVNFNHSQDEFKHFFHSTKTDKNSVQEGSQARISYKSDEIFKIEMISGRN
jgi:hypothetical protein